MTNTKKAWIVGLSVIALVIAGSIFLTLQTDKNRQKIAEQDAKTLAASTSDAQPNTTQPQSSAGGLDAQGKPSQNTPGQPQSLAAGQSEQKLLDPSTFGQYDKYKDSETALFIDLQKGEGEELTANKKAVVAYKGWLTNGQLFDSSKLDDKGQLQPFVFTLGEHHVIAGWEQGMAGMKAGGVRLLVIPPSAGYGASGQGPIPGNSVLVFQVQLIAVQ